MYLTVGYNNSKKLFDDSLLENMNDHHSTGQSYEEYNKPAPAQSNSRKEFLVDGEPVQADSEEQALHIALKQGAKEVIFKLDGKVKGEWTWNDGEKSFERDVLGDNGSSEEECKTEGLAQVFINGQLVEGAYGETACNISDLSVGDIVKFVKKNDKSNVINGRITSVDGSRLKFTNTDYPDAGEHSYLKDGLSNYMDIIKVSPIAEGAYGDSNKLNIKNPTDISYWFEHSVEPILFITKKLVLDSPEANKEVVAKILAKAKSDELEDIEGWSKQCDADDKRDCSKAIKWFAGKSDKEKAEGCADMLSDANYHSMAKLVRTLF